jgi:hypothetical protein
MEPYSSYRYCRANGLKRELKRAKLGSLGYFAGGIGSLHSLFSEPLAVAASVVI